MFDKMRRKLANWIRPKTPLEQAVVEAREAWEANDVLDLVNSQLEKVEGIAEENKELIESAHRVWSEPAFQKVIDNMIHDLIDHSVLTAESWERVLFDRASINGMSLVKEKFEHLEGQFQIMIEPPKSFDKHEIL